jgi:predicted ATP-dependent protease
MNQLGLVQPIGGINAKIEGFFDACALQGLSGQQGVILPVQNVQHLMLRQDVIDAVHAGHFHLHAVRTVEETLALLMNKEAGVMTTKGLYPKDTVYGEVMRQLKNWQKLEEGDPEKQSRKKEKDKKRKKDKAKAKQQPPTSEQPQPAVPAP